MSHHSPHNSLERSPDRSLGSAYSILFVFFAFVVVASFLPNARLWGINHLAFYPLPVRLAALLVMFLLLLPRVSRAAYRWFDTGGTVLTGRRRLVLAAAFSLVSLVLFIAFSSATQLLGDGLYTTNNIERGARVDPETFVEVIKNPYPVYPGTEMVNLTVSRFAARVLQVPPLESVKILNALLGALLVFLVVSGYRPSGSESRGTQASFVVLALLTGGIQMFFGYIEAYAPLIFFTGLYVLAVHRTLTQGAGLRGPAACALAAIVMHFLGLILVPSLAVLVLWVASQRAATERFLIRALVLAVATIAIPWGIVQTTDAGRFILPLTSADHSYAVWSSAHLVDIANEMLLIFPGIVVLGGVSVMIGVYKLRSRQSGGDLISILGSEEFLSSTFFPKLMFAMFLWIPSALFLVFFRPELGMARDWDLFAITAVGPCAVLFAFLGRFQAGGVVRRIMEIVTPPVLVMTAVLVAAWVGINAHPSRSAARFESILSYDHTSAGYGYEALASLYKENKDAAAEIRALEKAVEASRNPRYLFTLGLCYFHVGEKEKAVSALERCLRMRPRHDRARQSLAQMLFFMQRYDDLRKLCKEGARLSPKEGFYPFLLGKTYLEIGRVPDALAAFDDCRRLNPPPEVANEINNLLRSIPPQVLEEHQEKNAKEKTP